MSESNEPKKTTKLSLEDVRRVTGGVTVRTGVRAGIWKIKL